MINFSINGKLEQLEKQIKSFDSAKEQSLGQFADFFHQINETFQTLLDKFPNTSRLSASQKDYKPKKINKLFEQANKLITILLQLNAKKPDFSKIGEQHKEEVEELHIKIKTFIILLNTLLLDLDKFLKAHSSKLKHHFSNLGSLLTSLKNLFIDLDPENHSMNQQKDLFDNIYKTYIKILQIECQKLFNKILNLINTFDGNSQEQLHKIKQYLCRYYEVSSFCGKMMITFSYDDISSMTFTKLEEIKILLVNENQKDKGKAEEKNIEERAEKIKNIIDRVSGFNEIAEFLFRAHEQQSKKQLKIWNKNILNFIEKQLQVSLENLRKRHPIGNRNTIAKNKINAFDHALMEIRIQQNDITKLIRNSDQLNLRCVVKQMSKTNQTLDDLEQATQTHCAGAIKINGIGSFIYYLKSKVLEKLGFEAKSHAAVKATETALQKRARENNLATLWQQVITKQQPAKVKEITLGQVIFNKYSLNTTSLVKENEVASSLAPQYLSDQTKLDETNQFRFDDSFDNKTPAPSNASPPSASSAPKTWEKRSITNSSEQSSSLSNSVKINFFFSREPIKPIENKSALTEALKKTEPANEKSGLPAGQPSHSM
jgi:hypothetical protein